MKSFLQALSGVEVLSLSVVRKYQAPSSGNRPLRHAVCGAASALCADIAPSLAGPCSGYRSLGCRSAFSGSFLSFF